MIKNYFEQKDLELERLYSSFDDFKTWGFMGDPFEDNPDLSTYYLVPKKRIVKPKNENSDVDYRIETYIISRKNSSYFCCKYLYSSDEFQKTNFHGSFKIKICNENKLILDWIVKYKSILLINHITKGTIAMDPQSLLDFMSKHMGFILPFHDVSGLAFSDDYLNLL